MQAESIAEEAIADLTAVNRALDRRVAERTEELEAALERLGAADEVKSHFLRGVAHEMSTPLHAIQGFLELVEARSDDPQLRGPVQQAARAAQRLNDALRTLVEFAAVSAGGVQTSTEVVRLGDRADAVAERWRLIAARRGVLLVVDVDPDPSRSVEIDPVRLDQIIDTLVDNAVRFAKGTVTVTIVHAADPRGAVVNVEVADDGDGVPAELGESMFESFVRGDRSAEGFGVGLTLARLVAEALGGTIEHVPTPSGGGARFVASLPLPAADGPDLTKA